jgi:aspartyl protease family protein
MKKILLSASLLCLIHNAAAVEVGVVGLFPGKAVLVVDGANPKTYSVGSTIAQGVKLIAADGSSATIDLQGKRHNIRIGEHVSRSVASGPASVTLQADSAGHFMAQGQINGGSMRMLVDTGATMIAMSSADARRLGIDYKKGEPGWTHTANGAVPVYRVKLDSVKLGDITLNQVDAVVQEAGLPFALLGMSFLNRTEMRREGELMTLTKRY